jgi:hypothetical protein
VYPLQHHAEEEKMDVGISEEGNISIPAQNETNRYSI